MHSRELRPDTSVRDQDYFERFQKIAADPDQICNKHNRLESLSYETKKTDENS